MKLGNKKILKYFKDSKGEISWDLVDYIMDECGFKWNPRRASYDLKKINENTYIHRLEK